jgi:electron-transferring-flavoprotein dehydrogenase
MMMSREKMNFDVVIVGAGPAGLAAAIRLMQISQLEKKTLNICIVEKGEAVGAHILSGAVLEPKALNELIPDWQKQGAPVHTPVQEDQFLFLTENKSFRLPVPTSMQNNGNYIISLGLLCRWLGQYAEKLGVNIFPGFAATEILYENNTVCGIATGDKGRDRNSHPTNRYQAGIELYAKQVIFAEGCRGFLTQQLFERYQLRQHSAPQTYALGIKELWEVPENLSQKGKVIHTIGWPLPHNTYGGSFIYHLDQKHLALGFVIGLDYKNPYLNPYQELQKFKNHSLIASLLKNSRRIAYGARALNEGGFQSIPKLTFPGGVIIGCGAGFLNVPKMKGIHNAMKSGMLAAEAIFPILEKEAITQCQDYQEQLKKSWLWQELYQARNIRPAMRMGLWPGLAYAALETYLFKGRMPWTLRNQTDHTCLNKANHAKKLLYPQHNNVTSFNLTDSVYLTNIHHHDDQPCHLKLKNNMTPITINLNEYASPETRYCPAGVYEVIFHENNEPRFQINSANCIHCKACDIKDPTQNIVWTPPEGGSGPQYEMM